MRLAAFFLCLWEYVEFDKQDMVEYDISERGIEYACDECECKTENSV